MRGILRSDVALYVRQKPAHGADFMCRFTVQYRMQYSQYITLNPEIRFGKPCIIGTRITVEDVLSMLANGMTNADILEDFPELRAEHIQAVLAFSAERERAIL